MNERMNGSMAWMNGRIDEKKIDGWVKGRKDGWKINQRMDGWMERRMDGKKMDEWCSLGMEEVRYRVRYGCGMDWVSCFQWLCH